MGTQIVVGIPFFLLAIAAGVVVAAFVMLEKMLQPKAIDLPAGIEALPPTHDRTDALCIAEVVRSSECWQSLIDRAGAMGYELHPATRDDILVVNPKTRHWIFLSESGHFFPYLIERLGPPPSWLVTERKSPPTGFAFGDRKPLAG